MYWLKGIKVNRASVWGSVFTWIRVSLLFTVCYSCKSQRLNYLWFPCYCPPDVLGFPGGFFLKHVLKHAVHLLHYLVAKQKTCWYAGKIGEEEHSLIRSQTFSEPVPMGCNLYKCFCFCSPVRWEREARRGWSWLFLLNLPQSVKIWWNSLSWGQVLLRIIECSDFTLKCLFSLSPARSGSGFLTDLPCGNTAWLLEVKFTKVGAPPRVQTEPPGFNSLREMFSIPVLVLLKGFAPGLLLQFCDSLYLPFFLSKLGGSGLPYDCNSIFLTLCQIYTLFFF